LCLCKNLQADPEMFKCAMTVRSDHTGFEVSSYLFIVLILNV
jgi:hypothetical protein